MKQSSFFILFSLFLVGPTTLAETPLVEVFCASLILQRDEGTQSESWKQAIAHELENRQMPLSEARLTNRSQEFGQCREKMAPYFSRGEFILNGKKWLERETPSSAQVESTPTTPTLKAALSHPYLDSMELSLSPSVEPPLPSTEVANSVAQRRAHYEALWKEFLEGALALSSEYEMTR